MSNRLKINEGKISGFVSIFLGTLSFLAVFCFKYPKIFTSPEFRAIYTGEQMRMLLIGTIVASLLFAIVSFILSKKKSYAVIAMILIVLTIFIGGLSVEPSVVEKSKWYFGQRDNNFKKKNRIIQRKIFPGSGIYGRGCIALCWLNGKNPLCPVKGRV